MSLHRAVFEDVVVLSEWFHDAISAAPDHARRDELQARLSAALDRATDPNKVSLEALYIASLIDLIVREVPGDGHPWAPRLKHPPAALHRRQFDRPILPEELAEDDKNAYTVHLDELEERHNERNPQANSAVVAMIQDFCARQPLPRIDGADDVWFSYRKWWPKGGKPRLRPVWRSQVTRPLSLGPEYEPEMLYPRSLGPLRFSPLEKSLANLDDELWDTLRAIRDSLMEQARKLERQARAQGWQSIEGNQRKVAYLVSASSRLYQHLAEGKSIGQIASQGRPKASRSTVDSQIKVLREALNI